MKKKALIIFLSIFGLMFALLAYFGTATPDQGDTHSSCHSGAGYTILSTSGTTVEVNDTSPIFFNITATGSNLFVQAIPEAKNNDQFVISPTTARITDGSGNDSDLDPNEITVMFNVTAPAAEGYYILFILAGDNNAGKPGFALIEIGFSVGGAAEPVVNPLDFIFDHLGLYLGMPALILLTLGTILVLVNENKFVKVHGFLAGGSWILTVINVAAAVIKISPQAWLTGYELIYHLPHIILGSIGLITGFFSMLFGIAAERKPAKLTGYITLICWWAAFFTGYLLNSNLLLV